MKIAVRVGTMSVVLVALLVAFIEPAGAHAAYSDSNPADESNVSSPPSDVWAEFTEPPAPGSYLEIYDECGARVDNGDSRLEAFRIYITMASSSSGTYRVDFHVLSAYDNHVTEGSFTFDSISGENCAGEEEGPGSGGGSSGSSGGGGNGGSGDGTGGGAMGGSGGSHSGHGSGDARGDGDRGRSGANGGDARGTEGGDDGDGTGLNLARDRERSERGLMDGIEWGEFAFALAIAAIIGAAGGKVYAGIVGPRR